MVVPPPRTTKINAYSVKNGVNKDINTNTEINELIVTINTIRLNDKFGHN